MTASGTTGSSNDRKGSSHSCSSSANNKVRVVARIRPLNAKERAQEREPGNHHEDNQPTLRKLQGKTALIQVRNTRSDKESLSAEKKWYELDAVLEGHATQAEVYAQSGAQQAVTHDLLAGINTSILAYGQTGAGKTFTMGTASAVTNESAGIIPRACADLFINLKLKCENSTVTLSYLEVYNEQIRDLFAEKNNSNANSNAKGLRIREATDGTVQVQGVVEKVVTNPAEIGKLMQQAASKRVVAATAMNATSSRSHAICTLRIKGTRIDGDDKKNFTSKLTLVDLAGSERIKKTGAQGARQTEGININKSLLVLGQVVSALASPTSSRKPPYRDSKLTRLLQDSLGGNSRTILVACVSPAMSNVEETMNTLRYAASARRITNKVRANVASNRFNLTSEQATALKTDNARLSEENSSLQAMVQKLQEQLREQQQHSSKRPTSPTRTASTAPLSDDEDDSQDTADNQTTITTTTEEGSAPQVPQQIDCKQQEASSCTGESQQESLAKKNCPEVDSAAADNTIKDAADKAKQDNESTPTRFTRKSEADYIMDISDYKLTIAQLKERLDFYELLEAQNEDLQRELAEAKADAEVANMAASYLSDIVDELRDIKQREVEKSRLKMQMMFKEQSWISYVQVMLENFRENTAQLSANFDNTVVKKIESLQFTEGTEAIEEASSCSDTSPDNESTGLDKNDSSGGNLEKKPSERFPSQDELLRMAVENPKPQRSMFSRQLSFSFSPRRPIMNPPLWRSSAPKPSPLPWKECTTKFHQEISRVERMITAEADSMKSIQAYLAKECNALQEEVGEREAETENLFSESKEGGQNELVDHLFSMLLQRQTPQHAG